MTLVPLQIRDDPSTQNSIRLLSRRPSFLRKMRRNRTPVKGIRPRASLGLLLGGIAALLALAGCSAGVPVATPSPVPNTPPFSNEQEGIAAEQQTDVQTVEIKMQDYPDSFDIESLALIVGQTYQFRLVGSERSHTFTIDDLDIDYTVEPGEIVEFTYTPDRSGTFQFICRPHEHLGMTGTLRIAQADEGPPPPDAVLEVEEPEETIEITRDQPLHYRGDPPFQLKGYTFNPDSEDTRRVVGVEVYRGLRERGEFLGAAQYGQMVTGDTAPQEDVGFAFEVSDMAPGCHEIYLYPVFDTGERGIPHAVHMAVPSPEDPQLVGRGVRSAIGIPQPGEVTLPVRVAGWALAPSSQIGSGVSRVEVWLGSRTEGGTLLAVAEYGHPRSDVAENNGPQFRNVGYEATIEELPLGVVDLHVYAVDSVTGCYGAPAVRRVVNNPSGDWPAQSLMTAQAPVALAAAPDGRLFYNELTGRVRIVLADGTLQEEPFAEVPVRTQRESGLLGLALDPDFASNEYVYILRTVPNEEMQENEPPRQEIIRFTDIDGKGSDPTVIVPNLPANDPVDGNHNGGNLEFGPDGKLYVSIGDTNLRESAQDVEAWSGKILRFNPDGTIPEDNPFPGLPGYAFGFRNVFGMTFHPDTGQLYVTENGPNQGDQLNLVLPGRNYGWPVFTYQRQFAAAQNSKEYVAPIWEWEETVGPTGLTFHPDYPNIVLACGYHLPGMQVIYLEEPDLDAVVSKEQLPVTCSFDATVAPDGTLYFSDTRTIYRVPDMAALLELSE